MKIKKRFVVAMDDGKRGCENKKDNYITMTI
jgi:hypothetical protein